MAIWLVDGMPATPDELEKPLILHTHKWGQLFKAHLESENPHDVRGQAKRVFDSHFYEVNAHPQVYEALMKLMENHILNSDKSHPEIWGKVKNSLLSHTHPWMYNPVPVVPLHLADNGALVATNGALGVYVEGFIFEFQRLPFSVTENKIRFYDPKEGEMEVEAKGLSPEEFSLPEGWYIIEVR